MNAAKVQIPGSRSHQVAAERIRAVPNRNVRVAWNRHPSTHAAPVVQIIGGSIVMNERSLYRSGDRQCRCSNRVQK